MSGQNVLDIPDQSVSFVEKGLVATNGLILTKAGGSCKLVNKCKAKFAVTKFDVAGTTIEVFFGTISIHMSKGRF